MEPLTAPRILVIRRDNIGDLVCATPMIAALRARYPQARIDALVNSYNAAVLDGNPDLDRVQIYTKLKHRLPGQSPLAILLAQVRLFAELRRARYDYVILAKGGFDRYGLLLARRARARHIAGFAPPGEAKARRIDMPVAPEGCEGLHEVEVVMKLAEPLGVSGRPGPLRVFASPERVEAWRARLAALARRDRRWVALHISAREPGRVWAAERFGELARDLASEGYGVVVLWAPGSADDPRHPGDDERARAVLARAASPAVLAAPTETLEDLVAVLSLCDAFIGVDGGAVHLAAGLGLPMVALFENREHKKRHWYPWGVPYEMVFPPTRDVADIEVAQVREAWWRLSGAGLAAQPRTEARSITPK